MIGSVKLSMSVADLVREEAAKFGVAVADSDFDLIVWEHTGYPCFWATTPELPTPEAVFRSQIREWAQAASKGKK
jgi:hypothetical protein